METTIKAIISDLGGVLLRTEDHGPRHALAEKYGMTLADVEALVFNDSVSYEATWGRLDEEEVWKFVASRLNLNDRQLEEFIRVFWTGDVLDKDLINFIRSMRPRYRTGLLSNAWSGVRASVEQRFHCLDAFDVAMFSAEERLAKPDERFYHLILERLGVQPQEAVFLDDFPENIEAAAKLGIHAVHFKNSGQAQRDILAILDHSM